jgi:hypothetical protein
LSFIQFVQQVVVPRSTFVLVHFSFEDGFTNVDGGFDIGVILKVRFARFDRLWGQLLFAFFNQLLLVQNIIPFVLTKTGPYFSLVHLFTHRNSFFSFNFLFQQLNSFMFLLKLTQTPLGNIVQLPVQLFDPVFELGFVLDMLRFFYVAFDELFNSEG